MFQITTDTLSWLMLLAVFVGIGLAIVLPVAGASRAEKRSASFKRTERK